MGGHKVAFDLGLIGRFFSEGRNYTELTEALGELNYTENYVEVGGHTGFTVEIASWVRFTLGLEMAFVSEHFVTFENAGRDGDGDNSVDPTTPADAANPYYCGFGTGDTCQTLGLQSYDQAGWRLKSEEQLLIRLNTGLLATF